MNSFNIKYYESVRVNEFKNINNKTNLFYQTLFIYTKYVVNFCDCISFHVKCYISIKIKILVYV